MKFIAIRRAKGCHENENEMCAFADFHIAFLTKI